MLSSKYDRKGREVYAALAETKEHPSAETLFERLRARFPNISLNTVYRNIARLRREGNAVCVAVVDGQERYDAKTEPHPHFICDRCGAVIDMDMAAEPPELDKSAEALSGMRIRCHELVFRGLCRNCAITESETTENKQEEKS